MLAMQALIHLLMQALLLCMWVCPTLTFTTPSSISKPVRSRTQVELGHILAREGALSCGWGVVECHQRYGIPFGAVEAVVILALLVNFR